MYNTGIVRTKTLYMNTYGYCGTPMGTVYAIKLIATYKKSIVFIDKRNPQIQLK